MAAEHAHKIDPDVVKRLYEEEGLTTRQIAAKLGVSKSGVWNRLNVDNAKMRPNVAPMKLDRDAVYYLYVRQGLNINQVAKRLGVGFAVVDHEIERFGFRRPPGRTKVDKKTLRELYIVQGLNQKQVGKKLGMSPKRVVGELKRHNIKHRHNHLKCVAGNGKCGAAHPRPARWKNK